MSRQEAERIAVSAAWEQCGSSRWSEPRDYARAVVAALDRAGLLADPAAIEANDAKWRDGLQALHAEFVKSTENLAAECRRLTDAAHAVIDAWERAILEDNDLPLEHAVGALRVAAGTPEEQTPDERRTR